MKPIKSERGQSLVELGISLLILLYLLAGAVEFGIVFFQFVQLRDAAQEGALYGSTSPVSASWPKIEERARFASNSPIKLSDSSIVDVFVFIDGTLVWKNGAVQGATTSACEGHEVKVTVEFKHQIFMPFIPQILNRTHIPLQATVADTILTPVCP